VRLALEDRTDPQQQLARIEGLGEIIVAAGRQAADAVLGIGESRQDQDRHLAVLVAKLAGELEAGFARHHHIDDGEIEGEATHALARFGGAGGGAHPNAVGRQEALDQLADAAVVIDHEDMGRIGLGRHDRPRRGAVRRPTLSRAAWSTSLPSTRRYWPCSGSPASISA
jgi:hypothetical protein